MIGSVIRSWMRLGLCSLPFAGAPGCDFAPFAIDVPREGDAGQVTSSDGAAAMNATSDGGPPDASWMSEPDAGPAVHAACAAALPEHLPEPPAVPLDASGRPLFDLFRDVSCGDAAAQPLCDDDTLCPAEFLARCVQSSASDLGICAYDDENTGRMPFTMDDGRCLAWGVLAAHQRACCAGVPGVDCRAWPFDGKNARHSKLRELCAVHEDCEPGLLCKPYRGLGICSCPDSDQEPSQCRTEP